MLQNKQMDSIRDSREGRLTTMSSIAGGTEVTFGLAFLAGVLSLISPCVLALVPAYITYMTGVRAAHDEKARILPHALSFIMGFTIIFVVFGASATLLGRLFLTNQRLIGKVAGVLVAGFGLHTLGLLHIPFLNKERKITYKGPTGKPHNSMLIGMAFAAGWTPCVGPILGGILAIASIQSSVWSGIGLLFTYAIGMGLPFLILALTLERSSGISNILKKRHRTIEIVSGALLVIIGIMLYTDSFTLMARYLNFLNIL